jgi:hypothetical protein
MLGAGAARQTPTASCRACEVTDRCGLKMRYAGEWHSSNRGCMNGEGTWVDGSHYRGEWKQGRRHGYGICFASTGEIYKGEWVGDAYSGYGVLARRHDRFEGSFQAGHPHGYGIARASTHTTAGRFANGQPDAACIVTRVERRPPSESAAQRSAHDSMDSNTLSARAVDGGEHQPLLQDKEPQSCCMCLMVHSACVVINCCQVLGCLFCCTWADCG